jgi:hypothetical protein
MKRAVLLVVVLALLVSPADVRAQGLTTKPARLDDVGSLDAIVEAFYDVISHAAGQPIDWARDSTLYLADLRFKIVSGSLAAARANIIDHASYAASQGDISEGFFEREIHRVTQRFGPIAQVFSTYEWRRTPDGPVGGRGINSIELFYDGTRWWISSAMWTAETPENPIPQAYLRE